MEKQSDGLYYDPFELATISLDVIRGIAQADAAGLYGYDKNDLYMKTVEKLDQVEALLNAMSAEALANDKKYQEERNKRKYHLHDFGRSQMVSSVLPSE